MISGMMNKYRFASVCGSVYGDTGVQAERSSCRSRRIGISSLSEEPWLRRIIRAGELGAWACTFVEC